MSGQVVLRAANPGEQDLYLSEAEFLDGIVGLLERKAMAEAVAAYSRCQSDLGYPLVYRASSDALLLREVAALLFHARDYHKAAECCDKLGERGKAAQLYERCGEDEAAALLYAGAGELAQAARCYERSGRDDLAVDLYLQTNESLRAAECLKRLGKHFDAGTQFLLVDKPERALECFQLVDVRADNGGAARLKVAQILAQSGQASLAVDVVKEAIRLRAAGATDLPLWSALLDILLQAKRVDEAHEIARRLLAHDPRNEAARRALEHAESAKTMLMRASPLGEPLPLDEPVAGEALTADLADDTPVENAAVVASLPFMAVLTSQPLFEKATLQELRELYHLCSVHDFAAAQTLIAFGTRSDALWIVLEGSVDVMLPNRTDPVATFSAGEHFGEMSLIEERQSSAHVVARTAGRALKLEREGFEDALTRNQRLAVVVYRVFLERMSRRLRETSAQL